MDRNYQINENAIYESKIRALQDEDLASASETFNPLFETMINNTHVIKNEVVELAEKVKWTEYTSLEQIGLTNEDIVEAESLAIIVESMQPYSIMTLHIFSDIPWQNLLPYNSGMLKIEQGQSLDESFLTFYSLSLEGGGENQRFIALYQSNSINDSERQVVLWKKIATTDDLFYDTNGAIKNPIIVLNASNWSSDSAVGGYIYDYSLLANKLNMSVNNNIATEFAFGSEGFNVNSESAYESVLEECQKIKYKYAYSSDIIRFVAYEKPSIDIAMYLYTPTANTVIYEGSNANDVITIPSGSIDNLTQTGCYWLTSGLDLPEGSDGFVQVLRNDRTVATLKQIFYRYGTPGTSDQNIWHRTGHEEGRVTWGTWHQMIGNINEINWVDYTSQITLSDGYGSNYMSLVKDEASGLTILNFAVYIEGGFGPKNTSIEDVFRVPVACAPSKVGYVYFAGRTESGTTSRSVCAFGLHGSKQARAGSVDVNVIETGVYSLRGTVTYLS